MSELASARFKPVVKLPRLFVATGIAWLWLGGVLGLLMLYQQYTGRGPPSDYYSLMTGHGVVMAFAGLFQLMVGLSLLRGGLCYGKPTGGALSYLTYLTLNAGSLILLASSLAGVRMSYTLMFPLPAVGVAKGLWGLDWLTVAILGVVLVLVAMIVLYPAQLVRLLFFGRTEERLQLEKRRFHGILDPSMLGMAAYAFILPPLGSPILITGLVVLGLLLGLVAPQSASFFIDSVNFNYMLWVFAHNLMEAMGIMALATIYFIVPLYTADGRIELYSWKAARLAVLFYTTAATVAFFHHLYTMVSTQPLGLSYLGQVASWLTGFGAALTFFNVLATGWRHGFKRSPALVASLIALIVYISDGFVALQLATIGWNFRLHGTLYVTGHIMAILIAVMTAWFGELYHHFVVMTDRVLAPRLSYAHLLLTGLAGVGFMYSLTYLGSIGLPRRMFPWPAEALAPALPLLASAITLALAQALFVVNVARSRRTAELVWE